MYSRCKSPRSHGLAGGTWGNDEEALVAHVGKTDADLETHARARSPGRGAGGSLSPLSLFVPASVRHADWVLLATVMQETDPWTSGSTFVHGAVASGKNMRHSSGPSHMLLVLCGFSPCEPPAFSCMWLTHPSGLSADFYILPDSPPQPSVLVSVMHLMTPCTSSSRTVMSFLSCGLLMGRNAPVSDKRRVQGVENGKHWITRLLNERVNKYL